MNGDGPNPMIPGSVADDRMNVKTAGSNVIDLSAVRTAKEASDASAFGLLVGMRNAAAEATSTQIGVALVVFFVLFCIVLMIRRG